MVDYFPGERLHQVEAEEQSGPDVHLQPEHQVYWNWLKALSVLDENDAWAREQDEQNRVEEPDGQANDDLVDHGRNEESH